MFGYVVLLAFLLCIPVANIFIENIGVCSPRGPCLIPVAPGLWAPSGVLVIGIALVLRDAVQMLMGIRFAVLAVIIGGALSWALSSPSLALASVCAFLLSELADLFVYTPLAKRRLIMAVILSGAVGAAVDSAVFLWLAFGSLDYVAGQIVGKLLASVAAVPFIFALRRCVTESGVVNGGDSVTER